jgi:hypothetical protein
MATGVMAAIKTAKNAANNIGGEEWPGDEMAWVGIGGVGRN